MMQRADTSARRQPLPSSSEMIVASALGCVHSNAERLRDTVNILLTLTVTENDKDEIFLTRGELKSMFMLLNTRTQAIIEAAEDEHLQSLLRISFGGPN